MRVTASEWWESMYEDVGERERVDESAKMSVESG